MATSDLPEGLPGETAGTTTYSEARPTLVEFLTARLDEDKAAAMAATGPGRWVHNPRKQWHAPPAALGAPSQGEEFVGLRPIDRPVTCIAATGPADDLQSMADAEHIARWDPARVLAEVAAKRAIVERAEASAERARVGPAPGDGAWFLTCRYLALPYADHPDYDPTWAVSSSS